ncbi:hypothetical protein ACH347_10470 [Saccharopolyspora sp. 5N102]|uniref:hypothetical protein n=1 Tax=Saccharopolyspora sp. 5N102 TaxID=3375155 RepID=UPI00379AB95E
MVRDRAEWSFSEWVDELVRVSAPRVFALVEEAEDELGKDGAIVAWGLEFDDHAELVGVDGGIRGSFNSASSASQLFSRKDQVRPVWVP